MQKIVDLEKAREYFGDFMNDKSDDEVLDFYYKCLHFVKKLVETSVTKRRENKKNCLK